MDDDRMKHGPTSNPVRLELEGSKKLYLGEAVVWIICRGKQRQSREIAERWEVAERDLFDLLDADEVQVEGYTSSRIYEALPRGIWANMNRPGSTLSFFALDGDRELGGCVHVGERVWKGVRLPADIVFKTWPADDAEMPPTDKPSTARQKPQQARVMAVIEKLYPGGVPDRTVLTNTMLEKIIADEFSDRNPPSRESILRAAGRKGAK